MADAGQSESQRLVDFADRYYAAVLERTPELPYFTGIEVEQHDGLYDNSLRALADWHRREDAFLAELDEIDPAKLESRADWITYGTVRERLESEIGLRVCRRELWGVNQMGGWHMQYPRVAAAQPVDTAELRAQALSRWGRFAGFIRTETENLHTGVELGYSAPRSVTELVIGQLDKLLEVPVAESPFLEPARRANNGAFTAALEKIVTTQINPALGEYRESLVEEYLPKSRTALCVTANPKGRQCYEASLRAYTTLRRSPEEVFALGKHTVDANRQRVVELGTAIYAKSDFVAIIDTVKNDPDNRFHDREEILQFSRDMVARTKGAMGRWFGTLPQRDVVVEPYPPYQEGTGVSSRYERPRRGQPGVYRINLFEPEQQKKGGTEITAVHEAYPGHHLQIAIALDLQGLHEITKLAFNSGYVEGWARYAEALSEEMGLYSTQTALITRRAWPARGMVVDPGLHIMGWSRDEAIAFMRESGRFSPERAEHMVDRIAVLPGQLTAYDSGALEMFALRTQAEAALGERFDIRAFHDRLLENGTIPLWMMREHIEEWIGAQQQ